MKSWIIAAFLLLTGCSPLSPVTLDVADGGKTEVTADLVVSDAALDSVPSFTDLKLADKSSDFVLPDGEGEVDGDGYGSQCAPGEGCFLDPCDGNEECQSGWCVQHLGGGVCSQQCQEECPPGWSCQQVAGTDPDVVFICVSDFANLCRPCVTNDNCTSVGGAEDACVDYGPDGDFCGAPCGTDETCPWGFSCQDVQTVSDSPLRQCVIDTGECPCTESSVSLGLATTCSISNDNGTCAGTRTCTTEGLSTCDAPIPMAESCNGLDDDCDGESDEPTLDGGKYIELCDDDNACTEDTCTGSEGCVSTILEVGDCSDADPCTVADHCVAGACVGDPVECDDDNPCTENLCTATGGCEFPAISGECDDSDPCTLGDHCIDGMCLGTSVQCDCQEHADCAALEDGDLCNGTLLCETSQVPYQCAVDPATVVECPAPVGLNAVCLAAACTPETGQCSVQAANEAGGCDDGDPCTVGDTCAAGVCLAGGPQNCNDGDPCTDDSCQPGVGCVYALNNAPCSDGDTCTVNDKCLNGDCVPGQSMACDDGNPCTDDACTQNLGCAHTPNQAACSDGNFCTIGDHCAQGKCVATEGTDCDDANVCTDDTCIPGSGCVHSINAAPCDDADICTTGDHCQNGFCSAAGNLPCEDGNPCTSDSCNTLTGCQFTPADGLNCSDDNLCTVGETCQAGKCVPAGAADCNDGNLCTDDSCNPATGCHYQINTNPCDDNNACTIKDVCANSQCQSSGSLACDDGNGCTDDSCDAALGCQFLPNALACDDGDACTQTDTCANGECVGSNPLDCNDNNICTDESCDQLGGCQHKNNSSICDDTDACTITDSCVDGQCVGSGIPDCNDDKVCTDDSCDAAQGCLNLPIDGGCEDGNACTANDFCQNGDCQSGGAVNCDDSNPCTDDSCAPGTGCVHTPGQNCCVPTGQRVPYNTLVDSNQTACFKTGNPCQWDSAQWSWDHIRGFAAFGEFITCGGTSGCVAHVGIGTYNGGVNICHGLWDVYCDSEYQCTIDSFNKDCTGTAMTNQCRCDFPGARVCATIKLIAIQDNDNTGSCCGDGQPDSAIDAVSAW